MKLMMAKAGPVAGSATHSEAVTKGRHCLVLSPIRPIDTKWVLNSTVGLLARGSNRMPAFPAVASGMWTPVSAYSCGGSPGLGREGPHRIPCYPLAETMDGRTMPQPDSRVNKDIKISLYPRKSHPASNFRHAAETAH